MGQGRKNSRSFKNQAVKTICDVLKSEGVCTRVPQYLKDYFRSAIGQESLEKVKKSKSKDPEFTRHYNILLQKHKKVNTFTYTFTYTLHLHLHLPLHLHLHLPPTPSPTPYTF